MRFLAKKKSTKNHDSRWGLLFISVPVLSVLIFVFFPALLSIYVSMVEWKGYVPLREATFVGFENFAAFLVPGGIYTKEFLNALFVTLILMLSIPFSIAISFLLASVLNRKKLFMKNTFRLIYFLPFVSSAVAITLVFKNLFDINGVINSFLTVLGFRSIDWLHSPGYSRVVIIVMLVWRNIGYTMLMFLAGLQGIPDELYEAAKIDGAGFIKIMTKITLPSLTNITFFLVVTNVISGIQIYTEPAILFPGNSFGKGPLGGTESMMIFMMYMHGNNNLGMSSAISWAITIFILFATFIQFAYKKVRSDHE